MEVQKGGRKEVVLEHQVTAADPDQVTTPSLQSTQAHQLNNAFHLVSQLKSLLGWFFPNQLNFAYIWNARIKVKEKKSACQRRPLGKVCRIFD